MKSNYRAGVYGEQLWNYFCRSYPDNVAAHYGETDSYGGPAAAETGPAPA